MTNKQPPVPTGTGPSGRRLFRAVVGDWHLEEHELVLLREAVRTVDLLDELAGIVAAEGAVVPGVKGGTRVNPALTEARQLKIALARLLAALRLPDGADGDQSAGRRAPRRVGARGVYGTGRSHLGSVS